MGGCFSIKQDPNSGKAQESDALIVYQPLFQLKCQLLEKLNLDDDHYFAPFVAYRFKNNASRKFNGTASNIKMMRKKSLK